MNKSEIQSQALEAACQHSRSGINMSVGLGKTYLGLQYINRNLGEGRVLVVIPKVDIKNSWIKDAKKFELERLLEKIDFSTYISLNNVNPDNYEIVVLDEAHTAKDSHRLFLENFCGYILGLTGTPPRYLDSEKGKMMQEFYPIRFTFKMDQSVDQFLLNDYVIYMHLLDLNPNKTIEVVYKRNGVEKKFYTSEKENCKYLEEKVEITKGKQKAYQIIYLMRALKSFETKFEYIKYCLKRIPQNEKCLVFCNTTEQTELVCDYHHHSKKKNNTDLEKFMDGDITRLAAVEQLSEGINIPELRHIIVAHSYSNERMLSQKIGRAMRLNPGEKSVVHLLVYRDCIDHTWALKALKDFNAKKIITINVDPKWKISE